MISISAFSPHRIISYLKHRHVHANSDEVVHVHRDHGTSSTPSGGDGWDGLFVLIALIAAGYFGYKFVCWVIDVVTSFLSWLLELISSIFNFITAAIPVVIFGFIILAILGSIFSSD